MPLPITQRSPLKPCSMLRLATAGSQLYFIPILRPWSITQSLAQAAVWNVTRSQLVIPKAAEAGSLLTAFLPA